jgi:hypothetical protein
MKLLAHVMPWMGDGNFPHRMNSYSSNDPQVISNQLDILQTVRCFGVQCQGAILTWQGPYSGFSHSTTMEWSQQSVERGMLFALLMDPAVASAGPTPPVVTGNAATDHVIQALRHADAQAMLNASSYVPEKFVLDFSTGADLTQLPPHLPSLSFLGHGSGFGWPNIDMSITDSEQRNTQSVSDLGSQHANPAMRIPAVMLGFRDAGQPTPPGVSAGAWTGTRDYNTSVWGGQPARVLDTQGGKLFFDYWATVPGSAPYLGLVTWNDYDEGTDCEAFYACLAGIRIGS